MSDNFELQKIDGSARAGILKTRKGEVATPFFLSVATRGAIKAGVDGDDLQQMQAPVLLANTYHLHLRPGSERIAQMGGLHSFTGWKGPILTDSGGFQVFSLQRKKYRIMAFFFAPILTELKYFLMPKNRLKFRITWELIS